jgi:hypothetical protein
VEIRRVRSIGPAPAALLRRHAAGWRSLVATTALVPILVLLPLLGVPVRADKRFNPYRFGGEYFERPWGIVTDQLRSVPDYLDRGNFRPLGRIVERSQDLLAFALADALRLPLHVPVRALGLLAVAGTGVLTLLLIGSLARDRPLLSDDPDPPLALVPLAVAVPLVAADNASTIVLYTDLYFTAAAVALTASLGLVQHRLLTTDRLTPAMVTVAALGGVVLASFNELTYLGPPLALAALVARGTITLRLPLQRFVRTAAVKAAAVGCGAFLLVFVPARYEIARRCTGDECYAASDIDLAGASLELLGQRLVSWWPPTAWDIATGDVEGRWYLTRNPVLLVAMVAIVYVGVRAWRRLRTPSETEARAALSLGLVAAVLLILPAVLATLSALNQAALADGWDARSGWRDTTYFVIGAATLTLAVAVALLAAVRERSGRARQLMAGLVVVVLVAGAVVTLGANKTYSYRIGDRDDSRLQARIALAVTYFDPTPAGNRARCALLEEFAELRGVDPDQARRLQRGLDNASQARHQRDFCEDR